MPAIIFNISGANVTSPPSSTDIQMQLRRLLESWPTLRVVVLFGSRATDTAHGGSDIDVAVMADHALASEQKIALIELLADEFGCSVDLVDLREIGQPLLGEIVAKGVFLKGGAKAKGDLMFRSIMEQEDFVPYQARILAERRRQWIEQ